MERRDFLRMGGQSALDASAWGVARAQGGRGEDARASSLAYPLRDGYVDNWLVSGPLNVPIEAGEYKCQPALRRHLHHAPEGGGQRATSGSTW